MDIVHAGNIFLASDGAIQDKSGTYAYLLSDYDQTVSIEGMGIVPNTATDPEPPRAEFYGELLAISILLKMISIWFKCQEL